MLMAENLLTMRRRRRANGLRTFGQLSVLPAFWTEARNGTYQEATGTPTTAAAVDGVVGSLIDLSGNGRTLFAGTNGRRGFLRARAGGTAVELEGTDDSYRAAFTLGQPFTRVFCFNQITWTSNDILLDGGTLLSYYVYQTPSTPGLYSRSGSTLLAISPALGTPFVLTEVFDGASSKVRLNKGAWVTGNVTAIAAGGVTIGGRGDQGDTRFANMDFYGGAVFSAALSTDDLDAATTYAGTLAGLSL